MALNDDKASEACRLPSVLADDEAVMIRRMLEGKRVAVVGLSDRPSRPSHDVARYLKAAGYEIIPVNPRYTSVMGLPCYPSLAAVPGRIDVVNVFRRSEHCPDVVREAVAVDAGGVWLQQGIISDESEQIARAAGLDFVQDRCLKIEHLYRR